MINHRLPNWALAAMICMALASLYRLDTPTEHQTTRATAQSVQDAQRAAQRNARFERAARRMCGDNAAWVLIADTEIQCRTQRGIGTRSFKVAL